MAGTTANGVALGQRVPIVHIQRINRHAVGESEPPGGVHLPAILPEPRTAAGEYVGGKVMDEPRQFRGTSRQDIQRIQQATDGLRSHVLGQIGPGVVRRMNSQSLTAPCGFLKVFVAEQRTIGAGRHADFTPKDHTEIRCVIKPGHPCDLLQSVARLGQQGLGSCQAACGKISCFA